YKDYEMKDHLGNIRATIRGTSQPNDGNGLVVPISAFNYYAYGQLENYYSPGSNEYSFGFNGKEKKDDLLGTGNYYTYGFRDYLAREGRFISIDRLTVKYPGISPYSFALDNPISFFDPDGNDVKVHIGSIPVGTTKINLFSAGEIKQNHDLAKYTVTVPVYEVNVSNESGSSATYYFTRISYRGDKNTGSVKNVTFDVRNNGDEFNAVVKSRWGEKNNVLELRAPDNINNQTIKGLRDGVEAERTAIQMHVKGASDGCLLCTGMDQFVTKYKKIDKTNLKGNSRATQKAFMNTIQDFQKQDKDNGKGSNIHVQFDENTVDYVPDAPQAVSLPQKK
ncbi:MAG TPA: RHS repeat-associated core domain-containing protein, partial [Candidatus Babeliaceae bacterium]|nr:RHS repeat-associated core domain-containing protein [Candidatus Babeliaceae bacterium]